MWRPWVIAGAESRAVKNQRKTKALKIQELQIMDFHLKWSQWRHWSHWTYPDISGLDIRKHEWTLQPGNIAEPSEVIIYQRGTPAIQRIKPTTGWWIGSPRRKKNAHTHTQLGGWLFIMGKRLISHSPRFAQGLLVNSWILMTHCLFLLTKSRKKNTGQESIQSWLLSRARCCRRLFAWSWRHAATNCGCRQLEWLQLWVKAI